MLLCIDTGNTNTLFSIWDGERFLSHWRIATDHRRTADEYYVWLRSLMSFTVAVTADMDPSTIHGATASLAARSPRTMGSTRSPSPVRPRPARRRTDVSKS